MVRHEIKLQLQAFVAAFQFLTRVKIPIAVPFNGPVLARSILYFPLAGAFIGACLAVASWLLAPYIPVWPSAVLILALWTALSGGLHLDGWMDTADGVLSHRSRERMLEIMKDSRVGAMGVLAAVLLLLFKASLLAELYKGNQIGLYWPLLVCGPVWSRAWMGAAIAFWPNARKNEGMGVLFNEVKGLQACASFLVSAAVTYFVFELAGMKHNASLMWMLLLSMVTISCGGLLAAWLHRKLGGLTGDTYGAMNEAVEAVLLFAIVVWIHNQ